MAGRGERGFHDRGLGEGLCHGAANGGVFDLQGLLIEFRQFCDVYGALLSTSTEILPRVIVMKTSVSKNSVEPGIKNDRPTALRGRALCPHAGGGMRVDLIADALIEIDS